MKIATFNVNSIRARHEAVLAFVTRIEPDVLCMQETKVVDEDFPTDEFLRLGYAVAMAGQKTYNGVAIASRLPMKDVRIGLHDEPHPREQRIIQATIDGVRVYSVYVPNGNSPDSPSFPEKLAWIRRLKATLEHDTTSESPVAVCGDFNVAPDDRDVYDPEALRGKIHFHPSEHAALAELLSFGLVDTLRIHRPDGNLYTWWDYRMGAFRRNLGLRIDLILATPPLAARCTSVDIDVIPRQGDKPSDHTPVVATFS